MTTTTEHVIFGTGAIGLATLDALTRCGAAVRLVNRSGVASLPPTSKSSPATPTSPQKSPAAPG
jgi:hypothetical protein